MQILGGKCSKNVLNINSDLEIGGDGGGRGIFFWGGGGYGETK